jgi:succinate dehydrogenase / fumarate reductase cytochrome b subunit
MLKNNLKGIKGWFLPGFKSNIERWLFALHRITGILLIFYLFAHIFVVGSRAFGKNAWESIMSRFSPEAEGIFSNIIHIGEFLLVLVVGFHALNGIRLFITEFGFLIGKPRRPEYPYVASSLKGPKVFLYFLMLIFFIYILFGFYDFFISK